MCFLLSLSLSLPLAWDSFVPRTRSRIDPSIYTYGMTSSNEFSWSVFSCFSFLSFFLLLFRKNKLLSLSFFFFFSSFSRSSSPIVYILYSLIPRIFYFSSYRYHSYSFALFSFSRVFLFFFFNSNIEISSFVFIVTYAITQPRDIVGPSFSPNVHETPR